MLRRQGSMCGAYETGPSKTSMAVSTTTPIIEVFLNPWDLSKTDSFMTFWVPMSYKVAVAYIVLIFGGQKFMKNRKPFELDTALALWNFGFSLFSGIAAYHLLPELLSVFSKHGFLASYCDNHSYYTNGATGFWGWMFVMSKAPELGDTAFLVLRKKPVIFMHWYHHVMTFVFAQITYSEHQAWARWSLVLNLLVHTVMYFYFGVRALKIQTPRPVAKFITTIQLTQFAIQLFIFIRLLFIKSTNSIPSCAVSWNPMIIGGLMYLSYLYLFAEFFYNAYIKKTSPKAKGE